jgi:hypothetical protein
MNLIEAIRSGKRIRRKLWAENLGDDDSWVLSTEPLTLLNEDLLAEDWEAEELTVRVTRNQFFRAFSQALTQTEISHTAQMSEVLQAMARSLGI